MTSYLLTLTALMAQVNSPQIPPHKIMVIAHRGANAYAPENTLASFRLACKMKADWFELDCTLTRDGQVIVLHDDTVDRTTNGKGRARDLTLEQIRKLDAGIKTGPQFKGEKIPTLAEALACAGNGTGVYIEIKNYANDNALIQKLFDPKAKFPEPDTLMKMIEETGTGNLELTRKVIALVREQHKQKDVVIQSFSPIVCAIAVCEAPDIRTELLGAPRTPEEWQEFIRRGTLLRVKGLNPNEESLIPDYINQIHAAGKTIAVWTVDDERRMETLARQGVDAIITNRPDVCLKKLEALGLH